MPAATRKPRADARDDRVIVTENQSIKLELEEVRTNFLRMLEDFQAVIHAWDVTRDVRPQIDAAKRTLHDARMLQVKWGIKPQGGFNVSRTT